MNNRIKFALGLLLFAGILLIAAFSLKATNDAQAPETVSINQESPEPVVEDNVQEQPIKLNTLKEGDVVTSPLEISGQARGFWYFEAEFVVRVVDEAGKELGYGIARADGDWMTTEFVPFTVKLTFIAPATAEGEIIFEKSNPSGLEENAAEFRLPIKFDL